MNYDEGLIQHQQNLEDDMTASDIQHDYNKNNANPNQSHKSTKNPISDIQTMSFVNNHQLHKNANNDKKHILYHLYHHGIIINYG